MKATTTDPVRSAVMRSVKSKDTAPEMLVRRLVHGLGYRYRLHRKDLPGNPDLVFPSRQKVIQVNGCFWHGHDCLRGARQPKANAEYWLAKVARNVERDGRNEAALREGGWDVLVIWECQTKLRDREDLAGRLRAFLSAEP
ncbi:DNA mismatch endonuclease Vsr [Rhizobium ruizarguesonis]|nr:DNA mismatch endonuclease Vsr [Rhizobium ruizarguesonis]UED33752.1 DNA mismatch endonuclease Vsr [Rhizobium ruizarguesonis]